MKKNYRNIFLAIGTIILFVTPFIFTELYILSQRDFTSNMPVLYFVLFFVTFLPAYSLLLISFKNILTLVGGIVFVLLSVLSMYRILLYPSTATLFSMGIFLIMYYFLNKRFQ